MPYQGKSVSILEMLEILTSSGRSEAQAGIELERAFEDKAIRLLVPAGSEADVRLWRELSIEETMSAISLLRDLCNRAPIKTIATWNLPIDLFKATRAIRAQFERECGLVSTQPAPVKTTAPMDRKDAVQACIDRGMIPAPLHGTFFARTSAILLTAGSIRKAAA
jgi:hypothetical protein